MSDIATYYNDCTVPMPVFIRCSIHHDYSALIISGMPTDEELLTAWLEINNQYVTIIGDATATTFANDINRSSQVGARIMRISMLVESLRISRNPAIIQALRDEDFGVMLDADNEAAFTQDLDLISTILISDDIEYQELLSKHIDKQTNPAPPPTESQYTNLLFEINKSEGIKYNMPELTAGMFAELMKRLRISKPKIES